MHELSLIEGVVDAVTEQLGAQRVTLVRLAIGELAGVAIDALRFSFEVCTRGTPLEGATLEIIAVPGRALCRRCGGEFAAPTLATPCPCGSFDRQLVAGDELTLVEVETEDVSDLRM